MVTMILKRHLDCNCRVSGAWYVILYWLQVHAEGEAEHAAIGHRAVAGFVPASKAAIVRTAMQDHDRDFADFYNAMADMLE